MIESGATRSDKHHVSPSSDAEIEEHLGSARRGEQAGYTGLYRCLAGQVAGFVRSRGITDVDAVVNEVFLGAFRNLDRFEGASTGFRSWLFTIAWNKVVDVHRAEARRVRTTDVEGLTAEPVGGNSEDDALAVLGGRDVERLLARLTPEQRDVVLLRIVADLSLEETAAVTGRPIGAVKSMQHRALAAIRRILDEPVPLEADRTIT